MVCVIIHVTNLGDQRTDTLLQSVLQWCSVLLRVLQYSFVGARSPVCRADVRSGVRWRRWRCPCPSCNVAILGGMKGAREGRRPEGEEEEKEERRRSARVRPPVASR